MATIVNWMMQAVTSSGTAAKVSTMGITAAGKTGTTNDENDGWFIGLTPNIVTGVWVGFDTPRTLGFNSTGGHTALPI